MNRMMIVAAREISARKLLFLTAPLWGLLIAGLGVLHEDRSGGINAPTICALIFGIVMSLVIGSGLVGRELAERRLSFHFARPLSGTAIWGGKLLGGLVAVVASQLLVVVPSLVIYRGTPSFADAAIFLGILVLLSTALVSLGIHAGIALRSKSAWAVVDLCVLVGAGLLVGWAWRIFDTGTYTDYTYAVARFMAWLGVVCGAIVTAILLGASAAAVIAGRCDLQRAHRAASLVLLGLVPAALVAVGWAHWFVRPTASDVVELRYSLPSPDGKWLAAMATFRGRGPLSEPVLISTDRRRMLNVGPFHGAGFQPGYSADGRLAAWIGIDPDTGQGWVATARLDGDSLAAERSKTLVFSLNELQTMAPDVRLSPTGDAVVLHRDHRFVAYRLSDGAPMP